MSGVVSKMTRNGIAIADAVDADLLGASYEHGRGYRNVNINGKTVSMHRVVMERVLGYSLPIGATVDHINGNKIDNRRENLRLATHSQNNANRPKGKNNTTGFKGVYADGDRYRARIRVNKRLLHLGRFDTPEDAHSAYVNAAEKHFGEFAHNGEEVQA